MKIFIALLLAIVSGLVVADGLFGFSIGSQLGFPLSKSRFTIPREDCICPAIFQPVCGIDGVTYPNACQANCAGVLVIFDGPCY